MTNDNAGMLEDVKIDVKLKISALWVTVMLLFAYGDIFGYLRTGFLQEVMAGRVAGIEINQIFLLATSLYITIPSAMVFLSLVLKPRMNRRANIVLGIVFPVSILLLCIGETWYNYIFLSILECIFLLAIVWYAWTWPKLDPSHVKRPVTAVN